MGNTLSRRSFLSTAAVAGASSLVAGAPAVVPAPRRRPVVIASANGNTHKNGGPRTCVAEVWERMIQGADVLDAIVAGVSILERDPEDTSVGYGGLPNADGVVQLDASVIHGSKGRAGAVAALEGVRTPAAVARDVMNLTDHHLLVGAGAQAFARQVGFDVEADLNTDRSRALWLEWKRKIDPEHWLDPERRERAAAAARDAMLAGGRLDRNHVYGTVHCSAITGAGAVAAATSTSGLAFKIPGRVGDSPILGAGTYADGGVGAAGSTGRGEANLYGLLSFFIVERMREGRHPKDACFDALRRVRGRTTEKRLLNGRGLPRFSLKFYALDDRGDHAGVSLYAGESPSYAVCDEGGPRSVPMDALLEGQAEA